MVLVYSPGRVGTISLYRALVSAGVSTLHMHDHREETTIDGIYREPQNHGIARHRMHQLQKAGFGVKQQRTITSVRDPIARAISAYCFFSAFYVPPKDPVKLKEKFLSVFPHTWYLNFFDNQIGALFETDILSKIDTPADNFWHIETELMDLCILKIDHFNLGEEKVKELWNIDLKTSKVHSMPKKGKAYLQYTLLNNMRFPKEFTDKIYSSKLVSTFFTSEDIQRLKDRWTE